MGTSVKMDDETKAELEELQAEIRLETGKRVTQQELLARLVDRAIESREDLLESFRDDFEGVDESAREAFHEGTVSSGVRTAEEDVDDVLYG